METMTDFEAWLKSGNEPDGHEESYALWRATGGEETGIYGVSTRHNSRGELQQVFIKGPSDDTLALLSPKAIRAFRSHIGRYKLDDDLDWEGSYEFRRAMSKDD